MSASEAVDWCLDNNVSTIINNYGVGCMYELADLEHVWDDLKPFEDTKNDNNNLRYDELAES